MTIVKTEATQLPWDGQPRCGFSIAEDLLADIATMPPGPERTAALEGIGLAELPDVG